MQQAKEIGFNFEPFAETKEYINVNKEMVRSWINRMVERGTKSVDNLLDVATGVGTMAELLLELLPLQWRECVVLCLDQSEEALKQVQNRLSDRVKELRLIHTSVEEMSLPEKSIDVAVWGNGIHYLSEEEQRKSIEHIKKVLKPGGWFFFNTSFYEEARPTDTISFYRAQIRKAVQFLRSRGVSRDKDDVRAEAAKFHPKSYYKQVVEEVGFSLVETEEFSARLYQKAWEYISSFHQYAAGALHGYPTDEAALAMQQAVEPALEKHGEKDEDGNLYITRKWLAVSAQV